MVRTPFTVATLGLLCAGCASHRPPPHALVEVETPARPAWESIASAADRARIDALKASWIEVRQALGRRLARLTAAQSVLLDPDAALDLPELTPGSYRCRLVRIGGPAGYAASAPDFCYVDGDRAGVSLTKQTGDTLPGGWLHPDGERRLIFLGALRERGAASAPGYGTGSGHDVVGVVERIGPFRWRLVLAGAGSGARLDLFEITPVVQPLPAVVPRVGARPRRRR